MLQDMSINAEQVKSLRESRGWSQEHLAEVSGLSLRTIQRVEAEGKGARETKLSLAAAFDVPIGRLCHDEEGRVVATQRIDSSAMALLFTGTLLAILGLIAGADLGMLLAAVAVLISGLSTYGIDQLNTMRRAAGLRAVIQAPIAIAGTSILISASSVMVLGFVIGIPYWWVPAGILGAIGALLVVWPLVMSRALLAKP